MKAGIGIIGSTSDALADNAPNDVTKERSHNSIGKWGIAMFMRYLQVRNFRNLLSTRFEFLPGANTVIGENDSGKSNAMTAIRILLDSSYFYNPKRLKETDFSEALGDWKGHWIIISAYFDQITEADKHNELCAELTPAEEDEEFLKSYIRCEGYDFGIVTLFIRPIRSIRVALSEAENKEAFEEIRKKISLTDYEFFYTARSQADFTDSEVYKEIVGDFEQGTYADSENEDAQILGTKIDILSVWQHISVVFIDALRDAESELKKPKNPIRRVFDSIQSEIRSSDKQSIKDKIHELNNTISSIQQIMDIGQNISGKLHEIVGLVYSPEITVESRIKEDIESLAKYLAVSPTGNIDIDILGLGHLNILYIALKLVEFEYNRNHEILNIMVIEEPEAHIHTHIQKTLFDSLKISNDYTQVIMTTHSTHLSEVSDIRKVNVLKSEASFSTVMRPTNQLDNFGERLLDIKKGLSLSLCLERYLDARRSVLLFSKGVLLVEGDGEEILLPSMLKNALGVSLDEIGIGLINVGSVSFEYVASMFHSQRLQRHCAIITDSDTILPGARKCSAEAAARGEGRKQKLQDLYGANSWVNAFYAPYTFEVDFANEERNRSFIESVIKTHYVQQAAIDRHIANLSGTDAERYDTILTVAKELGKGWYATLLSSIIDKKVVIPNYMLQAIAFASQSIIDGKLLKKMALHALDLYTGEDIAVIKQAIVDAKTESTIAIATQEFCEKYPDNNFAAFVSCRKDLE